MFVFRKIWRAFSLNKPFEIHPFAVLLMKLSFSLQLQLLPRENLNISQSFLCKILLLYLPILSGPYHIETSPMICSTNQ